MMHVLFVSLRAFEDGSRNSQHVLFVCFHANFFHKQNVLFYDPSRMFSWYKRYLYPIFQKNEADYKYLKKIRDFSFPKAEKLLVFDARPKINAQANLAKGGGYEKPEFYKLSDEEINGSNSTIDCSLCNNSLCWSDVQYQQYLLYTQVQRNFIYIKARIPQWEISFSFSHEERNIGKGLVRISKLAL